MRRTARLSRNPPGPASAEEVQIFLRYASRHGIAARYIWPGMVGNAIDGSDADLRTGARVFKIRR
jgi:hypothetical protein